MWPLIVIVLVVLVLVAIVKGMGSKGRGAADFPYQKKPTLFSPAERSFFGVLEQAVDGRFYIMGQVRLADVIHVRPGLNASDRQKAKNRIQSKHLDFVVCDPNDLAILFAVELDDKSHAQKKRKERDAFLNAAMDAAGVPLIRVAASNNYSIQNLRDSIDSIVNPDAVPPEVAALTAEDVPPNVETDAASDDGPIRCPSCDGDMVPRKGKRGKMAGLDFLGCSNYPKCKTVQNLPASMTEMV